MATEKHIFEELTEQAPGLAKLKPGMPYQAPSGYFQSLPGIVLSRIKTENAASAREEIESISPLLSSLKKQPTYTVPEGYFESLRPMTPAKKQAPVKSISFGTRMLRYAAAAIITGIIAVTVWYTVAPSANNVEVIAKTTNGQAPQQILQQVNTVSDNEIANYVEGNIFAYEPTIATGDISDEDISFMLMEISDKELETYLN